MAQAWQSVCPSGFDAATKPPSRRGGAEQLTARRGGAEQPTFTQLPDDAPELTVGFYNVGIQLQMVRSKNRGKKERALKQDVVNAFTRHELHMLCLSELGSQTALYSLSPSMREFTI